MRLVTEPGKRINEQSETFNKDTHTHIHTHTRYLEYYPAHKKGMEFCHLQQHSGAAAASGPEEIPHAQGKEQQLCFAGAALKRYPMSKVKETSVRQ